MTGVSDSTGIVVSTTELEAHFNFLHNRHRDKNKFIPGLTTDSLREGLRSIFMTGVSDSTGNVVSTTELEAHVFAPPAPATPPGGFRLFNLTSLKFNL